MKKLVLAAVLAGAALACRAASPLPTVEDVQAEVSKGNFVHAEEMMRDVVAARPGSARAHYIYAEILARGRRFDLAAQEAARAKAIDPALAFTEPDKFRAFEQQLQRQQSGAQRPPAIDRTAATAATAMAPADTVVSAPTSGLPGWVWAIGGIAIVALAWRALGSRRQAAGPAGPAYGSASAPAAATGSPMGGYAPAGYPGAPAAGGLGAAPGGFGGGLARTGLAVAGGVAAGMLAEKLLDGHHDQSAWGSPPSAAPGLRDMAPGLIGGADPAADFDQRPVDFGNGDEWGGSDPGGAGSDDSGGGDGGW